MLDTTVRGFTRMLRLLAHCVGSIRTMSEKAPFTEYRYIRCFGEPRRWGTLEGTPGPGRTAQSLEGTFREPGGGEESGGEGRSVKEEKKEGKKKEGKEREGAL